MHDECMGFFLAPSTIAMPRLIRNPFKRRFPLSTCINGATSEGLEEAALHHDISLSEISARILAAAVAKGIPASATDFQALYPLHHDPET